MALFGNLFGKSKESKKKDVQTQGKELSFMVAIPKNESDIDNLAFLLERLKTSGMFTVKDSKLNDMLWVKIESGDLVYAARIDTMEVEIPELFRIQHFFRDIDIEAIQMQKKGLVVEMPFDEEHILDSYHMQLKLIHELLPDCLAVMDGGSEKVLSGKWVALAAESNIPPSPHYIFSVQAVSGDDKEVWLHSHGMNRCGLPELEILNSTKDTYNDHYNIIETMAKRLLENGEAPEEKEPMYLAMLTNEIPLMATIVNWKEAVKKYPSGILGGAGDRKDSHNENTDVIFCYPSPEAMEKKKYCEVSVFNEYLRENPLYMLTDQETDRMHKLAAERLDFMKKMFGREKITILLKVGIEVDEEFKEEGNSFEHIWFELKKLNEDTFTAELTQEPYYVKDLHEKAVMTFPYSQITDWIILTPEGKVTPDDVYLLAYDGWNFE